MMMMMMMMRACACDRFGDNDVEVAAAGGWDDASDMDHHHSTSYVPQR